MPIKKQTPTKEVVKILPDRIRIAREAASLTTLQLAKILGKSKTWLSFRETGRRPLYRHDLQKIAQALHKPVVWFTTENLEKENLHWKAKQYDRLMKELAKFCSTMTRHYTEMSDDELDNELERLGIVDARFKPLLKAIPVLAEDEKQKILSSFRGAENRK